MSTLDTRRRIQELGIQLPPPPAPLGAYVETVQSGNLLFLSGMLPVLGREPQALGRLGRDLDADEARSAVRIAALNALSAAQEHLGTLDRIARVVRLGVYLATTDDFFDHPRVADAASELFESVFGQERASVRLVVGVASLPLGMPVAVDVLFEVAS
jgi:enamine deaminase RidA (YjgF/YER057c/UK114 family)